MRGTNYYPQCHLKCFCFHCQRSWVSCEYTHVLSLFSFWSLHWRMDIVVTWDGVCTLVDVFIINPTLVDLVLQVVFYQGTIVTITLQATIKLCCNWHLGDVFLSLIIEVFGCLHEHVKNFSHQCANMAWSIKGFEGEALIFQYYVHSISRECSWCLKKFKPLLFWSKLLLLGRSILELVFFQVSHPSPYWICFNY